jgi:hypothetical protein
VREWYQAAVAACGQGRVTFEARPALVVFGAIGALALLGMLLMCGLLGVLSARWAV